MKEVLKKYNSQKHKRSTKKVYFFSASGKFLIYAESVLLRSTKKVYFSEAWKKY